ncbi:MAG: hypothetical protein HY900_21320 [Deltaproteobacteria bacterium]|nr:hypothetical protein [Deltaproteobacteria bacterium]
MRVSKGMFRSLSWFAVLLIFVLHLAGCAGEGGNSNVGSDVASNTAGDTGTDEAGTEPGAPSEFVPTGFPQVVVVSGTNYEMGVQYGEQAAAAIARNATIFKSKLYDAYGEDKVTKDMEVWDYYLKRYDPQLEDWIKGISAGCKKKGHEVSYLDLVLLMVYPTELWSRPLAPYPAETGVSAARFSATAESEDVPSYHSCNTFAATGAATPDGKPIHGITSMQGPEMMDGIVLIAFPSEGASFVSTTYAGRVNANAAMNSNGIAWTMTAILGDSPAWGLTEVYFHWLAQTPASIDEALDYIRSTPAGGVAGGFILSDASGNIRVHETISVAEPSGSTSTHSHLRALGEADETGPWVVQTNHLVDPSLQAYNPFWLSFIGTYTRYDTVSQYLKEAAPGTVDFEFAKSMFASSDWYDAVSQTWHPNEPGAPGISNDHTSVAQSIFFPADRVVYLQTGTPSGNGMPAYATGEYVRIKLAGDPKSVTYEADADALALYWEAADLFEHELNAEPEYLTPSVISLVQDALDEAMLAYSAGMEKSASANLSKDDDALPALWASALTYFAKAQLEAQMAKTTLLRARGP